MGRRPQFFRHRVNEAGRPAVGIFVVGEAIMDRVDTAAGILEHPGGSPVNVACGLARLNETVQMLTSLGNDPHGQAIAAHLRSAGVQVLAGSVASWPTSTALVRLDPDGSAYYEFDIRWSLPPASAVPAVQIVHTGSIGALVEPGATVVESLLAVARNEAIITFDPNIRPSLLRAPSQVRARFQRLCGYSDVVKLSDEDAEWLYPGRPLEAVLDTVLGLGASLAVLTRGAEGAILSTADARVGIPSVPVTVADTIGAGDSFMSAMIHHLARLLADGIDPERIKDGSAFTPAQLKATGRFAARCAAITVSRPGAEPPRLAEIERFASSA